MTVRFVARHSVRATRLALRLSVPPLAMGVRYTIGGGIPLPDEALVPAGREIELPGRGTTYVVDLPGPTPDAPTLVLLHGIFTSGRMTWFSVLEELNKDYRVVTMDQRWHGRGIASEDFRLNDCADDVAAVLDALGIDRAIAVGYSMGGAIAQVLAQRHPERLAGLVLCSTAAKWSGNKREAGFYSFLESVNGRFFAGVGDKVRARRESIAPASDRDTRDVRAWALGDLATTTPWTVPHVLAELGRFDATGWLSEVTVPTGVVITGNDHAIPTERQFELAALLPAPHVVESPGGHASLVFDLERWRPLFFEVVAEVAERSRAAAA